MRISVVRPDELGPADIAAWHSMQRTTATLANPFMSPEFAVAVGRFRPAARVAVLTDGPSIAGFFPFERQRLRVGVPIGGGLNYCQGLVHAPGVEWVPRELLRACDLSVWQFDHLAQGQRPFEHYRTTIAPSPVIDLADGFESYHQKLRVKSPKFVKEIERKARKLAREAGELRLVADSRDADALQSLMAWKSNQYRRTGRMDRLAKPWIVGLIDDLFATCNSHFSGLLSVLYAGDVPVAADFGLRSGHVLAGWFTGYDTRFSKTSPGLILHLRLGEAVAGSGVRLIDMAKGAKDYKETLKNGDIFVGEGMVTGRSALALAHRAYITPGPWAVRKVMQHPPLFRAADQVLQKYGRLRSSLRSPANFADSSKSAGRPPGQHAPSIPPAPPDRTT
jgi:CelD/BcsL family acetyltransferase involved in cellulose biosynthesis